MPLYIAAQCQQGDLLAGKRAGAKTGGAEQPRAANHALWGNGARLCKSHSETRFSDQLDGDAPQWQKIYVGNLPQQYDHESSGGFLSALGQRVHCRASGGQCRRGQQLGGQRADGNRHRLYCTASTGGVSAYPWT